MTLSDYDTRALARLRAKTIIDEDTGCHIWQGSTMVNGYGRISYGEGSPRLVHRLAYELLVGPIPDGMTLDHLCRRRECCNTEHLEPVSQRENVLRGRSLAAMKARQTHCQHGHPFDGQNTYIDGRGNRSCKVCRRARLRVWNRTQRLVGVAAAS